MGFGGWGGGVGCGAWGVGWGVGCGAWGVGWGVGCGGWGVGLGEKMEKVGGLGGSLLMVPCYGFYVHLKSVFPLIRF